MKRIYVNKWAKMGYKPVKKSSLDFRYKMLYTLPIIIAFIGLQQFMERSNYWQITLVVSALYMMLLHWTYDISHDINKVNKFVYKHLEELE